MEVSKEIELPEGVKAEKKDGMLVVSAGDKQLRRALPKRKLDVKVSGNKIELAADRKDRALIGTFTSHFKNMISGVQKPFVYELKICSTHFPMSVKAQGSDVVVENYIGGRAPKKVKMPEKVEVSIKGDAIKVSSPDIERAGMAASRLEQSTRLTNKDRRIFQDGIFITKKPRRSSDG